MAELRNQPQGGDFLEGLVRSIPILGSYLSYGYTEAKYNRAPDQSIISAITDNAANDFAGGIGEVGHGVMSTAGSVFSMASSADPTQLALRPLAHMAGLGGTEWDKGVLGLTGTAFDKLGRLATYVALTSNDFRNPLPNASYYNRQAWNMAFAGGNHINFGEAMVAPTSVVTDPNGLQNLRTDLAGTWYGHALTGALDFAMYSAVDPTRGVAGMAGRARAASYVADAGQADRLANTANAALDAGEALPKLGVAGRTALGSKMSDRAVAGYQWHAKARLDNVTDVNKIINEIDPRIGAGGGPTKGAIPAIAEMYADASRVTSDVNLQRQIKLNVDYALTGSGDAMNWLAENYPGIAAKGRRMSGAPSEFTLLEDAMDAYANKGNVTGVAGESGFDLGSWVQRHYSDPAQQAELTHYGNAIENLQRFRSQVWESGPEGGPVEFGTSKLGVQVAPRNLEKIKTAINNKVGDSYLYQDGATGRTVRVITSLTTPGAHGFVSLVDPILGNRQLVYTLRQFSDKVDGITPDTIKGISQRFLSLDPAARERYVRQINDDLLGRVAAKYDYTPEQAADLLSESSMAYRDGRQYASDMAKAAASGGNANVWLGDLGGSDTVLEAQHLLSHLNDTAGLLDWETADNVVRSSRSGGAAGRFRQDVKEQTLRGIATYHTMWKHAQLGRPGLIFRVLMDTDLRANAMIGTSALFMEALRGAGNFAKNAYATRTGSVLDEAVSSMAWMNANEVRRAATDIRAESAGDLSQAQSLFAQSARANELADIFKARQRQSGRFHSQTQFYKRKEAAARALADRLMSDRTAIGNPEVPRGIRAVQLARNEAEPGRVQALDVLSNAEDAYLTPESIRAANATRRQMHVSNGVEAPFSLAENDMQLATLPDEVRGSGAGLSDLLLNNMDTHLWQGRREANHWQGNVAPDDVNWHKKYSLAMQEMRDSHTMRRLLVEGDAITSKTPAAVLRSYLSDPSVVAEFRATTAGGGTKEEFTHWLSDLATSVKSMTPNADLKAALNDSKVLTPEEIDSLVPAEERFPIFGPNIVNDRQRNLGKRALDRFYRAFVDLPDVYLARIPAAVGLYHQNIDHLMPSYAQKALDNGRNYLMPEEAQELHLRAKGRAMNDARRDMYDIHRRLGSEGVMRYIAPFFAPWFDAIQSWARLIYDDPTRYGQLMRYAQTPDMFHLTTDKDGNEVNPWDGTSIQDKTIRIPLFGLAGLDSFGVNFGSMNTISQGNTPFSPGAGPLAQVAGTVIVGGVLPKVAPDAWKWMQANPDNLVSQSLFPRPGDVPKADLHSVVATQMPSYMRTFSDVFMGSDGFGNVYTNAFGTRYNDLIRQYREDHGGADPNTDDLKRLQKDAETGARAAALARSVVSFNLGLSGNATPEGQFYVDKMHSLVAIQDQLKKRGLSPEQVFAANYPSAANLNWSFSVNEGNLQATVNATTNYMKHRTLMDQHPDVMWWIAGPDNLVSSVDPNGTFSQGAYNQQMTEGLRRKFGEDDMVKQTAIAMGQGRMNAFNDALRLYMAQQGLTNLNSKAAGGLSTLRASYQDQLRAQFPQWAEYYDGLNSQGLQDREIDQIRSVMAKGGSEFNSRPDVRLTQQYLTARDSVIAQAASQGVIGWQTANSMSSQRDLLYAYGSQLARKDVVFAQAWDRLFSNEFNSDQAKARQLDLINSVRA